MTGSTAHMSDKCPYSMFSDERRVLDTGRPACPHPRPAAPSV
ncbi:MAG: hypothetical protein R6V03_07510 [Kiritimatiellia bacterium]